MSSYFNYFTEIEEHFQRRRGSILLLSTLDWALIETWKDAGVPLEAVLRGIDAAFERWEKRPRTRKVNSLAYCTQEVMGAVEDMKEAAVGAERGAEPAGFSAQEVAAYLRANGGRLDKINAPAAATIAAQTAASLRELADHIDIEGAGSLEDLERRLTVMEEKLSAALLAATPDEVVVAIRADADRELAPYRRNMSAAQIDQLHRQYLHKRLFEKHSIPRLSLFYM